MAQLVRFYENCLLRGSRQLS